MSFCSECGTKLKEKAKFCQKCGAKVRVTKLRKGREPVRIVHRDRRFAKAMTVIVVVLLLAVSGYLIYYEKSFGPGSAKKHVKSLFTEKVPTAAVVSKLTELRDCPFECCAGEGYKDLLCGNGERCIDNKCTSASLT
jgi:hypothetical protein